MLRKNNRDTETRAEKVLQKKCEFSSCIEDEMQIICSCETREQLLEIQKRAFVNIIYVDSQMYHRQNFVSLLEEDITSVHNAGKQIFLKLPSVFRINTSEFYTKIKTEINNLKLDGFVVRNYEELYFVKKHFPEIAIVVDHNLYTYNDYAKAAFHEQNILRDTIPLELNQKEIRRRNNSASEMVIYGYYPLMTTAGCVHKNTSGCDSKPGVHYLKDRYKVLFPVKNNCVDCYNVIYNSVPVLLFDEIDKLRGMGIRHVRMDFTVENKKEVDNVLNLFEGKGREIEYTNGHFKRGVE